MFEHVEEYLENQYAARTIPEDVYVDLLEVLDKHNPKPVYYPVEISQPTNGIYEPGSVITKTFTGPQRTLDGALATCKRGPDDEHWVDAVLVFPLGMPDGFGELIQIRNRKKY